jgi:hypothetical protein
MLRRDALFMLAEALGSRAAARASKSPRLGRRISGLQHGSVFDLAARLLGFNPQARMRSPFGLPTPQLQSILIAVRDHDCMVSAQKGTGCGLATTKRV